MGGGMMNPMGRMMGMGAMGFGPFGGGMMMVNGGAPGRLGLKKPRLSHHS